MMPVPTHLKGCVVPTSAKIDESDLKAKVQCPCGGKTFELLYPGQTHEYDGQEVPCVAQIKKKFFFLVKAKCTACRQESLLIDVDFHGWNGFVCHDARQAKLPRPPLVPWKCQKCGGLAHKATVQIQTQGKADFIEESGGMIDKKRWPDAFGCFSMSIECTGCRAKTPDWVCCETM